ncbi:ABC transporter permease [Bacillus sp. AK128]
MLLLIIRKILNNRWLVGSLLLGLIISVSLVSSIPTYSSSILQKLLIKELENHQIKTNEYPGQFYYNVSFSKVSEETSISDMYDLLDQYDEELTHSVNVPIINDVAILSTEPMKLAYHEEGLNDSTPIKESGQITSLTDLDKHITITDGKFPESDSVDGIYEVLVTETALVNRGMTLGTILKATRGDQSLLIKPVGTFRVKDERDPYWSGSTERYDNHFMIPESLFKKDFLYSDNRWLANVRFFTAYDYYQMQVDDIGKIKGLEEKVKSFVSKHASETVIYFNFPIEEIATNYLKQSQQLKTILWSLNVPILIMLAIYLFMVSRLIVDRQLNEIAVLRSRGASRGKILFIYLIETGLLAGVALVIGPIIGLFIVRVLGASNGFLDFVQRSALPVSMSSEAYLYGAFAVLASILMIMIPVIPATSQSIVSHKQQSARLVGTAAWHKYFVDVLLLGVSSYGWWRYQTKQEELLQASSVDLSVDPLLFFVPAMFIIGLGLFCLRIYPLLMKIIYTVGRKYWSLTFYTTLLQVSRSSRQYQFLMLFLVMTIAVGVFSASAARTINSNLEEQLYYENGADITLKIRWESEESTYVSAAVPTQAEESSSETDGEIQTAVSYAEPPFESVNNLPGIEQAAKVFNKDQVTAKANGKATYSVELMGIEPKQFGETAWFNPALLPHHWYEYLNLLAAEPSAVLISTSLAEKLSIKEGDYLTLNWDTSLPAEFIVYGIVDYWPSFNPTIQESDEGNPTLIVANLPYVQNMMGIEPYDIWLNMKEGASREELYSAIRNEKIPVTNWSDSGPKLAELKSSAFLLGLNGTLTLGFLISILITFIGFLLYWILTLKSRILQYGIYRAMGIQVKQLIGMLTWEQFLTSGLACLLGIAVGGITSKLFVPLFQLSFDQNGQVLPFRVIFDSSDEMKIYLYIIFMLTIGIGVLMYLLKRIRIHQAIRLGDD